VTPSLNQGAFIEETIRSVLLQGYPDLEYIVVDGGSTDNSVGVIHKYEQWLTYWVSEPDSGQSQAINKGFGRATGEIVAWLNSDDVYLPGVMADSVMALLADRRTGIAYGRVELFDEQRGSVRVSDAVPTELASLLFQSPICQPGAFLRRVAVSEAGYLDQALHYCFDYDLYLRVAREWGIVPIDRLIARYRLWPESKTVSERDGFMPERVAVVRRAVNALPEPLAPDQARYRCWLFLREAVLDVLYGEGTHVGSLLRQAKTVYPQLSPRDMIWEHLMAILWHTETYYEQEEQFLGELASVLGYTLRDHPFARRIAEIHFNRADRALAEGRQSDALRGLWMSVTYRPLFLLNTGLWMRSLRATCPAIAALVSHGARAARS